MSGIANVFCVKNAISKRRGYRFTGKRNGSFLPTHRVSLTVALRRSAALDGSVFGIDPNRANLPVRIRFKQVQRVPLCLQLHQFVGIDGFFDEDLSRYRVLRIK